MIKVNLLPQKKAKGRSFASSREPREPTSKEALIGVVALAGAAAAVYFVLDMPKRSRLSDVRAANAQLQQQINEKNKQLQGFKELKAAETEAKKRADSINRLLSQKIVPAHLLNELGKVLTREGPTMTEAMAKLAGNGPESDPNKRFDTGWDPSHVWMTSFTDNNGVFRLDGAAQQESDVTQLSKRLAASVYFMDVTPAGGERQFDRDSGLQYYKFTITGRLAY